ncbi:sortase [Candidatus Saccharibacteria bacterium]|nr:sortase [Candidatus Saccharibacteria bacterium]
MKPNDPKSSQSVVPLPDGQPTINSRKGTYLQDNKEATENVIKAHIDSIYSAQDSASAEESSNPYERTHKKRVDPTVDQWKEYHTAWQDYYRKYYEDYYTHHLNIARQKYEMAAQNQKARIEQPKSYFSAKNTAPDSAQTQIDEAVFSLRQRLLNKVAASANQVRHSRHFKPLLSGVIVVLILLFVQYNQLLVANVMAYISPGNIDPQNIITDPIKDVVVSSSPKLIIPKINVDVPVQYGVGNDYTSQMSAMQKGVAHFAIQGANARPGEIGNTVIAGHSSNDLFDGGDYKFIFAQLDKLQSGDLIYANYNSIRYTYVVTGKKVVGPSDVGSLILDTNVPIMTLLTCTPLGTSINRLLVFAKQISPDPSISTKSSSDASIQSTSSIPGNSPTLIEKLFGN